MITIFLEQPLQNPPLSQNSPRACLTPHLASKTLEGSLSVREPCLHGSLCQNYTCVLLATCRLEFPGAETLCIPQGIFPSVPTSLVAGWCLAKQVKLLQVMKMLLEMAGAGECYWGAGQQGEALVGACEDLLVHCLFELGCGTVGLILSPAFVWLLHFSFIWRRSGLGLALG